MRIILAGTGSAVGKTTIATGIMKALSEKYKYDRHLISKRINDFKKEYDL